MKKLTLLMMMAALTLGACQQDNKNIERKMDEHFRKLDERLAALEKSVATGAAAAARQGQQRPRRQEPDPKDVHAINVEGSPQEGPDDALVTIVKGYEYACPYCEKVKPTLEQIRKDYGNDVRVVYQQFVVHPQVATEPALAACAAHKQGKFMKMDKLLWEKAFAVRKFDRANMEALAKEAGLDVAKFKADMDGQCKDRIKQEQSQLQMMGQGATPTFFINGRYMSGAQPLPAFKAIIDEELKLAKERVAAGTPRDKYYQTWVVEKGLKKFTPKAEQPAPGGAPVPAKK